MSNLVGPQTLDTPSANIATNCYYPAAVLGGGIKTAKNVYMNGKLIQYTSAEQTPDAVTGSDLIPPPPLPPCTVPGTRVNINKINRGRVFINGDLPLVEGDLCQAFSTERPFTGPFLPGNVYFATGYV
jgi:hypothetical protein